MNDNQFTVTTPAGSVRVNHVHVFEPAACAHCRSPVTRYGIAIGEPYHALLHRDCLARFDYSRPWPHPEPLASYVNSEPVTLAPTVPPVVQPLTAAALAAAEHHHHPPPLRRRDSIGSNCSHQSACSSCHHCGR